MQNKKNFTGRSMIEMLGVLAIIGVLSIGGVSMYRKAILNYRLGQTQYWFENVRLIFAEACMNGNTTGCSEGYTPESYKQRADYICAHGGNLLCPPEWNTTHGSARTPLKETQLLTQASSAHSYITIYLLGLDKSTCKAVINYDWNGLRSIKNYSTNEAESVASGQKHLMQEQKDRLSAGCPFVRFMMLSFNLKR